jgi:EAL and modified HD-GYP domain-containing signal transduction protein
MTSSVLGSVTFGYEPIWNRWRKCSGVRLFVEADSTSAVDAQHLLAAIAELWPESAPQLLLQVHSQTLLGGLLDHAPAQALQLEIADPWLSDAPMAGRIRKAHQRGVQLVWSGDAGQTPSPEVAGWFSNTLRMLTPRQALDALRASLRQHQNDGMGSVAPGASPVVAGSHYQGLASQALVEHALDRQGVAGVAGWPAEEILHGYRFQQIQPNRVGLTTLLSAIDADESLESLERRLGNEPLLAYRFLRYANSAHLGARAEVDTIRRGLMVMGHSKLREWLLAQLPHANSDLNLNPIRANMVLRARIMERLADAGVEDDLRREVFLCGVLSQLDLFLGEPLGAALHRIPLPGRIASAIIGQSGPYAPWLEVATALESHNPRVIHDVCLAHNMPADEVNRALLRTLAAIR